MDTILDLCGGSGSWSNPYKNAGYNVVNVDILYGLDVRGFVPPPHVRGVLAAPPCTVFSASGARWWKNRLSAEIGDAVDVVRACLRVIRDAGPAWWALENPVGRINKLVPELGQYLYTFQPWEFGDPWTKRTCVWGEHNMPMETVTEFPVTPYEKGPWWLSASKERPALRSITPPRFAKAFFAANP